MWHRIQVALLVAVLLAIGSMAFHGWRIQQSTEANTAEVSDHWIPSSVTKLEVHVDGRLLDRLDAESPRLTLVADDGSRATVLAWRAKGILTLDQVFALEPKHYRTLEVAWSDGSWQQVRVDVAAAAAGPALGERMGERDAR